MQMLLYKWLKEDYWLSIAFLLDMWEPSKRDHALPTCNINSPQVESKTSTTTVTWVQSPAIVLWSYCSIETDWQHLRGEDPGWSLRKSPWFNRNMTLWTCSTLLVKGPHPQVTTLTGGGSWFTAISEQKRLLCYATDDPVFNQWVYFLPNPPFFRVVSWWKTHSDWTLSQLRSNENACGVNAKTLVVERWSLCGVLVAL